MRFESELRKIREAIQLSASKKYEFEPNPCLAENEVRDWEIQHGISLPEQYRVFIREIGNGGVMPGSYCDFNIYSLANIDVEESVSAPFPVTVDDLREHLQQLDLKVGPTVGEFVAQRVRFPKLLPYWKNRESPPGCVPIGEYPSSDLILLVTTGELRGSLWCAIDGGLPELDRSGKPIEFFNWFVDAVKELSNDEA